MNTYYWLVLWTATAWALGWIARAVYEHAELPRLRAEVDELRRKNAGLRKAFVEYDRLADDEKLR